MFHPFLLCSPLPEDLSPSPGTRTAGRSQEASKPVLDLGGMLELPTARSLVITFACEFSPSPRKTDRRVSSTIYVFNGKARF